MGSGLGQFIRVSRNNAVTVAWCTELTIASWTDVLNSGVPVMKDPPQQPAESSTSTKKTSVTLRHPGDKWELVITSDGEPEIFLLNYDQVVLLNYLTSQAIFWDGKR